MLNYIKGRLTKIESNTAIIETVGIGFKVHISLMTYNRIASKINSEILLYTHLVVKEDAFELFGFSDELERKAFSYLIKVSGIGPKAAIAILSVLDVKRLKTCILSKDASTLTTVPGIGKKTAQKIIFELKDKIDELPVELTAVKQTSDAVNEAKEALLSLGFTSQEIQNVLDSANGFTTEELITYALKRLSK